LTQLKELLDRRELSSLELTESLLDRIARADGKLHAFVEVYAEEARALARAADQARAARLPLGPLHGLPVVLKDLLDIEGRICTLGSKHYGSRIAAQTSATVERLLAAGMVPLGKVHMTEFAFGGWGTNPLMGTPHNPWDLDVHRVPGGSSSGTAVAVAAGFAPSASAVTPAARYASLRIQWPHRSQGDSGASACMQRTSQLDLSTRSDRWPLRARLRPDTSTRWLDPIRAIPPRCRSH
jgi:Asp-tRNA(Asn)/Glu-tRNA(Gln) amidotransferase A subunit family amidase